MPLAQTGVVPDEKRFHVIYQPPQTNHSYHRPHSRKEERDGEMPLFLRQPHRPYTSSFSSRRALSSYIFCLSSIDAVSPSIAASVERM